MQHLLRHFIIVLVTIAISFWAIYPLDTKLRLAKDLNGGATLVYQVEIKPTDPADTMSKMIDLLRKRIDPNGILEITMTPLGDSRIEITMPLPNDKVKELRRKFEEQLARLGDAPTSIGRLEAALKLEMSKRDAAIAEIAGSDTERLQQLKAAAAAFDKQQALRGPYEEAERAIEATEAAVKAAQVEEQKKAAEEQLARVKADAQTRGAALAEAEIAFADAIKKINASGASPSDVRRALELNNKAKYFTNAANERERIASPRERALEAIKASHPDAVGQIDKVIAAWDEFQKNRQTLDDPADLKRIVRGAGVLTFRIAVRPNAISEEPRLRQELRAGGPKAVRSTSVRWYKLNKDDGWFKSTDEAKAMYEQTAAYFDDRYKMVGEKGPDGSLYLLLYDEPGKRLTPQENTWALAGARKAQDEIGRPSIAFTMDAVGAAEMGKLTSGNLGQPMAVMLDDEVYTAPTLQSRISTGGQITGEFSNEEIEYIVRVLSAGSMAAKLSPEPVSESTIGPELGKENLSRGLWAGIISFLLISGFMIVYYFSGGVIATIALLINLLLLLAIMAINRAAFSLPGIAGVILAFGMAVDANVLIYERLREELVKGEPLRVAVRVAYNRALAPILDGNLTHLITCIVLGFTGTAEIKGFAITMSIGVITTLFCQLYITRIMYFWLVDQVRIKRVSMLPIVWPALQRAMTLKTDWMKLCPIFFTISGILVVGSLIAVFARGNELLDTVFRGGTRVTIQLTADKATGKPLTATRAQIQERIKAVVQADTSGDLRDLADPQILVIDPNPDNSSSRFVIQTTITDDKTVSSALTKAFDKLLDRVVPITFKGSEVEQADKAPIRPIVVPELGSLLGLPDVKIDVSEFVGGAAIVMENLGPERPTLTSLEERLRQMKGERQFAETLSRKHQFVVIKGTPQAIETAALLVKDEAINYMKDGDAQARWNSELRPSEWALVREAINRSTSFAGVERFDASIAKTFVAQAIAAVVLSTVAIVIFVWVRFNSLRYSLAAIIATLHDCIVAVGAIAVAEMLYKVAPDFCQSIGLLPFKIDLNVIAAVLTILGYSLNDKIVVMDRIRENRGKLPYATRALINDSINQTISRTIMTGTTVFIASLVLYVMGGEALRAFAYSFLIGVVTGTYSSIAVAAPIVWSRRLDPTAGREPVGGAAGLATT